MPYFASISACSNHRLQCGAKKYVDRLQCGRRNLARVWQFSFFGFQLWARILIVRCNRDVQYTFLFKYGVCSVDGEASLQSMTVGSPTSSCLKHMGVMILRRSKFICCSYILPPFQNIRCFSFIKQMYLDIF
jgi:hypothetical protein